MWPKLFRRLAEYFASGNVGLSGFDAWIREDIVTRDDAYFCRTANLAICTTYSSWKTISESNCALNPRKLSSCRMTP
jgi:hypothetical protein